MKHIQRNYTGGAQSFAPCVVDSSGNGMMVQGYQSPNALLLASLAAYIYGGSFTQRTDWNASYTTVPYRVELAMWTYLRKSGTNYYGASSFDGDVWSEETPVKTWGGTVDRIGMIAPLGFAGTSVHDIYVDWFSRIE